MTREIKACKDCEYYEYRDWSGSFIAPPPNYPLQACLLRVGKKPDYINGVYIKDSYGYSAQKEREDTSPGKCGPTAVFFLPKEMTKAKKLISWFLFKV